MKTTREAAAVLEETLGHLADAQIVIDQLKGCDGLPGEVQAKFSPELRNFIRRLEGAFKDVMREADREEQPEPREPHDSPDDHPYVAGLP